MRRVVVVSSLLLLSMTMQVQATARYWFNTGGNDLWSNGANWADSYDTAPQAADAAYILNGQAPIGNTNACQFTADMTASVSAVLVQGLGYNGLAQMNISGGVLNSSEYFIGAGGPGQGSVTMSGGAINSNAYFVVGQAGGNGTLNMTGGTITANNFWVSNLANSRGVVNLSGGTINIYGTLSIQGSNGGFGNELTGLGYIDITGGKVVFTKNEDLSAYIMGWAGAGLVKAYGGTGTVIATRDAVTGYTTMSAVIPEPASISLMAIGLCLLRRKFSK